MISRLSALLSIAIFTLGIAALCEPQMILTVFPKPTSFPDLSCQVHYYFFKVRTECPHQTYTNSEFPRDQGIVGCVQAFDRFRTAYALTIIGVITIFISLVSVIAGMFVPLVTSKIPAIWSLLSFAAFTVAWALSWSMITSKNCGRYLIDANEYAERIHDVRRSSGLNLLVSAWALSLANYVIMVLKTKEETITAISKALFE